MPIRGFMRVKILLFVLLTKQVVGQQAKALMRTVQEQTEQCMHIAMNLLTI